MKLTHMMISHGRGHKSTYLPRVDTLSHKYEDSDLTRVRT